MCFPAISAQEKAREHKCKPHGNAGEHRVTWQGKDSEKIH